jgi:hypothetical protein
LNCRVCQQPFEPEVPGALLCSECFRNRFPRTLHEAIHQATPLHLWRYIGDDESPVEI